MFKKISVSICVIVVLSFVWITAQTPIFGKYSNQTEVYLSPYTSTPVTVTGVSEYLTFIKYGESCEFTSPDFDIDFFLSEYDAKKVFTERLDGKISVYAYSPKLKYRQVIKGKTVNLHVVVSDVIIKVGSPIIYGSY